MKSWTQKTGWLILGALGLSAILHAQNFDLRTRIVNADDNVQMSCALEIDGLRSTTAPNVRVVGTRNGHLVFYGFSTPASVLRVGRIRLASDEVRDIAANVHSATDEGWAAAQIAVVARNSVFLMGYAGGGLTPQGYVQGVSASRVALLKQSDIPSLRFELAIGGNDGTVRLYDLTRPSNQSSFDTPVNLGAPKQTLVLPSNSPIRSLRYATGNILVVAVGQAIYRYVRQSNGLFALAGKDLRLFAPVAEMVADANHIVAASEDGYIYAWRTSDGALLDMLKERFSSRLGAHCLALLPSNRLAVGYQTVRLFNLPNFTQVGEVGISLWGEPVGGNAMAGSPVRPHFHNFFYTVLPPWSSGVNLATSASDAQLPRVAFVNVFPYHRRYPAPSSARPAVYAFTAAAPNRFAYGYADGYIRVYDPSSTSAAPILTLNAGAPIFAMSAVTVNNQPWVLFSFGAQGQVRAWNLTTNQVVDLIQSSTPRVVYALKVLPVSGTTVDLWLAASDGRLERWVASLPAGAGLQQSFQAANAPLWSLDINSSGHVAVGGADGIRYYVGAQSFSAATGRRVYSLAFRPGTGELAVSRSAPVPVIELYSLGAGLSRSITIERAYRSTYPYFAVDYSPALLSWVNSNRLAAADIFGGKVRIYSMTERALYRSDYSADDKPGAWDRNPVQAYEPVRDGILAFSVINNLFTVGSASGEGVIWASTPVNFTTYSLAYLTSVDFLPTNGARVYSGRAYHTPTTTHIPFEINPFAVNAHAYAVSGSTSNVNYIVGYGYDLNFYELGLDGAGNPLSLSSVIYRYGVSNLPCTTDITDSGRYALYFARWDSNVPAIQFNVVDLHSNLVEVATPWIALPAGSAWSTQNIALAPNGQRFALGLQNAQVQIYTRSGNSWTTPATFTVGTLAGRRAVRFVDDNRLIVAYPDGSPATWRLALYQLSGGSWTLVGSPVDTQLPYSNNESRLTGRILDVVRPASGNPRIALVDQDGLVLYKLSANTLQLVARSLPSTSAFLEASGYWWVRFSRHNPDRLGLSQTYGAALEVDISGLGW